MKRTASFLAAAAVLIPSLAFAATLTPTTQTFKVDLCTRSVQIYGATINKLPASTCTFVHPVNATFATSLLCAGKIKVFNGAVNVTAPLVAANCQ